MAKILIIDDDWAMRKLVSVVMRSYSHEVLEASDGATGISLAMNNIPDLIICDYHMPFMNGLDTLETIRKIEALKDTPVIVASTGINKQQENSYKKLGVCWCFSKPIDIMEVKDKILEILLNLKRKESAIEPNPVV